LLKSEAGRAAPYASAMPRRAERSVVVPYIGHQLLDYLIGLYLIQAGAKTHGRAATVSYVAGGVVLLAATLSGRPLGGGPLSRRLHRFVDMALVAGLAAAPFVFGLTAHTADVVRFIGAAVALAAVVWYGNYNPPRPRGETTRAIRQQGPRIAGQLLGRRMAAKRRPPER
jgi:hypothetical protein